MRSRDVTRSSEQVLIKTLREHRRRLGRLENQHSPTVPIYDPDFPNDAVNGQISLQEGIPYYYWDGGEPGTEYSDDFWLPFGGVQYAFVWHGPPTELPPNTVTGIEFDTLYTNAKKTFTVDEWEFQGSGAEFTGLKGLGIHSPGLYWLHFLVETFDDWSSGDPGDYQLMVNDIGRNFELSDPSFGAFSARGFHPLDPTTGTESGGLAVFSSSFSVIAAVDDTDDTGAGRAPVMCWAVHNAPELLTAYRSLLAIKLDSNNFNLFF